MPEGDSVLQLSNRLQFMEGRRVTSSSLRVPRYATVRFDGLVCEEVWPYGKHLFMDYGGELILHTHLKMEGTWAIHYAGDRWRKPGHSARVVLQMENAPRDIELVGHWLGHVGVFPTREFEQRMAHLGPDILAPEWEEGGFEEAVRRIESRSERSIGAALLDQRNVAGLGNEYRAEICFLAGVHPATPVALVDVPQILTLSRRLIWANRDSPVRVTTGVKRAGETTYVFGRNRRRCRRCGTLIEKSTLGGVDAGGDEGELERVIWWCPHCQPRR